VRLDLRRVLPLAWVAAGVWLAAAPARAAPEASSRGLEAKSALHLLFLSEINVSSPRGASNNPLGVRYAYPAPRKVQLDGRLWGECMALATRAVAPRPAFSKAEMRYTADAERSPLLDYLAATAHRTGDYATGREERLKAWLLSRPDNSVDPLGLYMASLALHDGNVWNAVLAIHQLLRNNARWWATERYWYRSSAAEQAALFNKLVDIRGDLSDLGPDFHGDHAGSWYRIWGAMLYRLGFVDDATFRARQARGAPLDEAERLLFDADSFQAAGVFFANETSKLAVAVDDDAGKLAVDLAAGEAAGWLLRRLWEPEGAPRGLSFAHCLSRRYMRPAPAARAPPLRPAGAPRGPGYVALDDAPL